MANAHYVDNKKLYQAIVEYRKVVKEAEEAGLERPPIPTYIGQCMLFIAQRLSLKPNFVNYSYREEMISDGIENCVCYFDNYNPDRYDNPFAYFTQIIWFAFLRRIQKEKKQLYIKHKSLENSIVMNELVEQGEFDGDEDFIPAYIDQENENTSEFIRAFEEGLSNKRKKRKKGVEKFIEDEQTDDANVEVPEDLLVSLKIDDSLKDD
jgi:hypothetical protein